MNNLPEEFDRYNDLRKELETKIDKKIDYKIFWGIVILLVGICGSIFNHIIDRINKPQDKIDLIKESIVKLETKFEDLSKTKRFL